MEITGVVKSLPGNFDNEWGLDSDEDYGPKLVMDMEAYLLVTLYSPTQGLSITAD